MITMKNGLHERILQQNAIAVRVIDMNQIIFFLVSALMINSYGDDYFPFGDSSSDPELLKVTKIVAAPAIKRSDPGYLFIGSTYPGEIENQSYVIIKLSQQTKTVTASSVYLSIAKTKKTYEIQSPLFSTQLPCIVSWLDDHNILIRSQVNSSKLGFKKKYQMLIVLKQNGLHPEIAYIQ